MKCAFLLLLFVPSFLFAQKTESANQSKQNNSIQPIDSLRTELSILKQKKEKAEEDRAVLRTRLDTAYNALEREYNRAKPLKDSVDYLENKSLPKKEQERLQAKFDEVLMRLEKLTAEANKSEELLSKKNAEIKELNEKISKIKKQIKDIEEMNGKSN